MRKFILFILILVVLAWTAVLNIQQEQEPLPATEQSEKLQVSLTVPGVSYELSLPEGATAYDLMNIAKETKGFEFKGKEFQGLGFFVEEINGLGQNFKEGKYWIYYINGQKANVGASSYILKPNDQIEWKYEKEI